MCRDGWLVFDDFKANAYDNSPAFQKSVNFRALLAALKDGLKCAVADIDFCKETSQKEAESVLRTEVPSVRIDWEFFANDPRACEANVRRRRRPALQADLGKLWEYSASYYIPKNARILPVGDSTRKPASNLRVAIAILLAFVALSYTAGIVTGTIHKDNRIDPANLGIIAAVGLAILIALQPGLVDRFKKFEISGFKLEMLERVRERQAEQAMQLEDMSLMLPFLLPPAERKHLLNLVGGATRNYEGRHALRSELRRLRSFGLIKMRGDKQVGMMKDDMKFDLQDFVELTDLGRRWCRRITEIEKGEPDIDSGQP